MRFVTTFSPEGFEEYGRTFLDTFGEHVDAPIDVYLEQSGPKVRDGVRYRRLDKVPGFNEFRSLCNFPAAHGRIWGKDRNYRFDVYKFCCKSFAQIDAAAEGGDWLYWIDADIEFNGPFRPPIRDAFLLYLDRPEWHSCASFVGFNLEHEISAQFFQSYWQLYVTGTVFALPEWHDSYLLDWLRGQMKLPAINLAAGIDGLDGPANVFDAVFPMAHHKKGNLKRAS